MLEDILKQSQPGVNPELEQMISKLMMGSGSSPQRANAAPQAAGTLGLAQSTLGTGTPGVPSQPGAAQPMAPEEANLTYQALIKAGVPEDIAKQAVSNPQMLQDLLMQLQQQAGPQEMGQTMASGTPNRVTPPPVGGGRY